MAKSGLGNRLDKAKDEESMRGLIKGEEKSALRDWTAMRASAGQKAADQLLLERIYRVVRILERKGLAEVLGARIKELHVRHRRLTSIDNQPFKQALFLFAGQTSEDGPAPFKRQRRHEWGDAFAFAHSQNVRGARVIEFIGGLGMKACHRRWKEMRNRDTLGT